MVYLRKRKINSKKVGREHNRLLCLILNMYGKYLQANTFAKKEIDCLCLIHVNQNKKDRFVELKF